jgi:hypothetical protein
MTWPSFHSAVCTTLQIKLLFLFNSYGTVTCASYLALLKNVLAFFCQLFGLGLAEPSAEQLPSPSTPVLFRDNSGN